MKVNRITIIICAAIVLLSGISIAFISNDLAKNIAISVFTGFIVSLVIATIGYFHERAVLLEKIDFGMKSPYINMAVLKETIGKALPLTKQAPDAAEAQIKRISGLAELNVELIGDMTPALLSPICKRGRIGKMKMGLKEFEQVAFNLQNLSANLQILHLSILSKALEIQSLQLQGALPPQNMFANVDDLRHLLIVRTSKLHEYTAAQIIELEKVAKICFYKKAGERCWETLKANLQNQVHDILSEHS